jgi:CRISPR-associated protein Csm2
MTPPASDVIQTAARHAATIVEGHDPAASRLLVEQAKAVGEYLKAQNLTTSQIRNVFGTVRSIESTWRIASLASVGAAEANPTRTRTRALHELNLLKPRMAYAASRNGVVRNLEQVLTPAINAVLAEPSDSRDGEDEALRRFGNFLDFFEAILAYHRAAGGK